MAPDISAASRGILHRKAKKPPKVELFFGDTVITSFEISQCCSMEVNCETLAVMAATLANGGECPISTERVVSPESVRDVLSLLHSCGFYEYSGQFAFKVG